MTIAVCPTCGSYCVERDDAGRLFCESCGIEVAQPQWERHAPDFASSAHEERQVVYAD